jgi:hypothetical protein
MILFYRWAITHCARKHKKCLSAWWIFNRQFKNTLQFLTTLHCFTFTTTKRICTKGRRRSGFDVYNFAHTPMTWAIKLRSAIDIDFFPPQLALIHNLSYLCELCCTSDFIKALWTLREKFLISFLFYGSFYHLNTFPYFYSALKILKFNKSEKFSFQRLNSFTSRLWLPYSTFYYAELHFIHGLCWERKCFSTAREENSQLNLDKVETTVAPRHPKTSEGN